MDNHILWSIKNTWLRVNRPTIMGEINPVLTEAVPMIPWITPRNKQIGLNK